MDIPGDLWVGDLADQRTQSPGVQVVKEAVVVHRVKGSSDVQEDEEDR